MPPDVKAAIAASVKASNSPDADDKHGGFHEEGGQWGTDTSGNVIVSPSKPGPYAPPGTNPETHLDPVNPKLNEKFASFGGDWHVHPRGTSLGLDGTVHYFVQPPSAADRAAAAPGGMHIVVGAGNKTVYFYNSAGIIGQMGLKQFMRTPR